MDATTSETISSVEIGLGAAANVILAFALAHTWRYWRQVKLYVVLLGVANVLEVAFTLGVHLGWMKDDNWITTDSTCKFLIFMSTVGPSLASMTLAALAVHVLLTSLTGNQGNRLRHALVMALFVVLSLPLPFVLISMYEIQEFEFEDDVKHFCGNTKLRSQEERLYHTIAYSIALLFFPIFVLISVSIATLALNLTRGTDKTDASYSDLILTAILGFISLVCCLPSVSIEFYLFETYSFTESLMEAVYGLMYLRFARPAISAVACVVFGYVYAFRNREQSYSPVGGSQSSGERQKLVN